MLFSKLQGISTLNRHLVYISRNLAQCASAACCLIKLHTKDKLFLLAGRLALLASRSKAHASGRNRKFVFCQSQLFEDMYKSFYWSNTQNSRLLMLYIVTETHCRALRACGACEPKKVYDMIICMARRFQRAIARPNRFIRIPNTAQTLRLLLYRFSVKLGQLLWYLLLSRTYEIADRSLNISLSGKRFLGNDLRSAIKFMATNCRYWYFSLLKSSLITLIWVNKYN